MVVVHGFEVVDGCVVVKAPPGHTVVIETVSPGAGVTVDDFKNGKKRHNKVLLPGPWLLLVVTRGKTFFPGKFAIKSEKSFALKAGMVLAKIRVAHYLDNVNWAL